MTVQSADVVGVACEGCGVDLQVNHVTGTVETPEGGLRLRLTYADEALAVWDCPACGHPDAADLLGA